MNKSIIISGSNGPERIKQFKELIDIAISSNDGDIVIYDATYGLVSYNKYENVSYYSVDTVNPYKNKLKELVNSNKKTYIFSDAYAAFMLSKENVDMFKHFLTSDNFVVVFSARHLSFVHEDLISLFKEKRELDDVYTVLSNDYNVNKK